MSFNFEKYVTTLVLRLNTIYYSREEKYGIAFIAFFIMMYLSIHEQYSITFIAIKVTYLSNHKTHGMTLSLQFSRHIIHSSRSARTDCNASRLDPTQEPEGDGEEEVDALEEAPESDSRSVGGLEGREEGVSGGEEEEGGEEDGGGEAGEEGAEGAGEGEGGSGEEEGGGGGSEEGRGGRKGAPSAASEYSNWPKGSCRRPVSYRTKSPRSRCRPTLHSPTLRCPSAATSSNSFGCATACASPIPAFGPGATMAILDVPCSA